MRVDDLGLYGPDMIQHNNRIISLETPIHAFSETVGEYFFNNLRPFPTTKIKRLRLRYANHS